MHRPKLFAGLDLDRRTREACAKVAARLQERGFPAKFEATEKLHITLAFLGWVDPECVPEIEAALDTVGGACAPFTLTLDKIGAFPHERKPRIIWIGARDQGSAFRRLADSIRQQYTGLGFAFEQAAVAHVTIARVKEGHPHLPGLEVAPVDLPVKELTLFESLPAGRTTRYEVRRRVRLQGRAVRAFE